MRKRLIRWIVVGCILLLVLTAIVPAINARALVNKEADNKEEDVIDETDLLTEDLQPLWHPEQHINIIEIAAKKAGWISPKNIRIIQDWGDNPDYEDPDFTPFIRLLSDLGVFDHETTEEWTWSWGNSHQYLHAYFPNPTTVTVEDLEGKKHTFSSGTGGADERCQYYYDKAMGCFNNGEHEEAFKYLGYASHYLQDVGNPLHTDIGWWQWIRQIRHCKYESYVRDNWDKFYLDAEGAVGIPITNPSDAVRDLAYLSHYVMEINYDGTWTGVPAYNGLVVWDTSKIDDWTHDQIGYITGYTIGFYNYVYDHLADLTIAGDISIAGYTSEEDNDISSGQTVTLSATVKNLGGYVENVEVTFFNDREVIDTTTITSIDNLETKTISVNWQVSFPHVIRAVVDANDMIFEQNEENNEKVEKLPDLYIDEVYTDVNPPNDFCAKIKNVIGGDTAYNIDVRFYDGTVYDNSNLIGTYIISSLSGGNTHTATCANVPISYGLHVTADQDFSGDPKERGNIGETDETNNKAEETSTVISTTVTWTGIHTQTEAINIVSGGKLIIDGAIVRMSLTGNGQHIIRVCEGGELIVKNNAKIQKTATGDYFEFIIYGKATIENSEITGLYFGLWICSDDVIISGYHPTSGVTIQDTRQSGIWCFSSSPTITGCIINVDMGGAITCFDHANPTITNNNLCSDGGVMGVFLFSNPTIENNMITAGTQPNAGGIACIDYSAPIIEGNTIVAPVGVGVWCEDNSNPTIVENTIQNSQHGIMLFNSPAIITNNLIQHNLVGVGCIDHSDAIIKNNHIILKEDLSAPEVVFKIGIYCEESNPTITKNNIESDANPTNSDLTFGLYLDHSSPAINDNSLVGIQGAGSSGLGIFAGYSSSLIINNRVSSCSRGIECNNGDIVVVNSTLTSIDEDFLITSSSASITMINTTFDQNSYTYSFYDSTSVLRVRWYLEIKVVDLNGNPVPKANVVVEDVNGNEVYSGVTDLDGMVKEAVCTQYTQNGPSESYKTYYTPHDISAQKGFETTNSVSVEMNANQEISLALNVIPDFTLSSGDITLADDGISASIWNNGKAYGMDVSFSVLFDSTEIATQVLPSVPPDGESTTVALLWRDVFFNPDGTHTVEINIDSENIISESNEGNNQASNTQTVTVTSAEIPTLQSPLDGDTVYNPITFEMYSTDPKDILCYRIELSNNNFATVLKAFNQLESLKGWSKETYTSGEIASYTGQSEDAIPCGTYQWRAQAFNTEVWSDLSDIWTFTVANSPPNTPPTPSGPTSGTVGTSYTYSTSATDPDADNVKYTFDWGDGTTSTTGFVASGSTGYASHSWSSAGTYYVKAMATDSNDATSGWSGSLAVTITEADGDGQKRIVPIDFDGISGGILPDGLIDGSHIGIQGHVAVPGIVLDGVLEHLPGWWEPGFCINRIIGIIRNLRDILGDLPGLPILPFYSDANNLYQVYYVNVSNPFNSAIIINLSVYGVPDGWDAYLSNYSVTLEPGEYVIITLTVVIPKNTTIGQTTLWVLGTIQDYDYLFMCSMNVTVGQIPVAIARVESSYPVILENDVLAFNASYSYDPDGTIIGYEWDFGDGANGTGMVVEHSYETTGNYIVTLAVRDNYNLTNSASIVVSVNRHSFEIEVQQITTEARPGETAVYMINIENTGTIGDTYMLRMTNLDSSWSYPNNVYVGVSAGKSITLYLKVTLPSDFPLMYNTTYNFTIEIFCTHKEISMSNAPLIQIIEETLTVTATKESKIRYEIVESQELITLLNGMNISAGTKNSLRAKLEGTLDKLNTALDDILNGDENHANNMLNCAENKINAFINEVEAQRSKKISEEDADILLAASQILINHIDDTINTAL